MLSTWLDPSSSAMIEFGKFCNFTPTSSALHFGGTCFRNGLKQEDSVINELVVYSSES
jgi:hypothetical protein